MLTTFEWIIGGAILPATMMFAWFCYQKAVKLDGEAKIMRFTMYLGLIQYVFVLVLYISETIKMIIS